MASAARCWLARYAAGVKLIRNCTDAPAPACVALVSCLPALEDVTLRLPGLLDAVRAARALGCLIQALALCPRLRALDLTLINNDFSDEESDEEDDTLPPLPDAPTFAELCSLEKLALNLERKFCSFASLMNALLHLTGLTELSITVFQPAVVPAALSQLNELQALYFGSLEPCSLEAGCLNLPNLLSLKFEECTFTEGIVLPAVIALQSLTHIEFLCSERARFFDPQLVQLPCLKHVFIHTFDRCRNDASLPADMGSLSSSLVEHNFCGYGFAHFPLALTQLVALESLNASENEFSELPAGITALSRLTDLRLGRLMVWRDPLLLHGKRALDARALGDLSGFPALCGLTFTFCEVILSDLLLGARQHPNLAGLCLRVAHPAPECALTVLQLGRELTKLKRGSVLTCDCAGGGLFVERALQDAQGRVPIQQLWAGFEVFGL